MGENNKIRRYKIKKALEEQGHSQDNFDVEKSSIDLFKEEMERQKKKRKSSERNSIDIAIQNINSMDLSLIFNN